MMQRLLRDTGIMKKILTMMILLGAVAILTAGVNAWKITLVDAKYSYMVDHRLPALTQLVRSLRHVNDGVFNGLQIITFPAGSDAYRRASVDLESGPATLEDTLRKAETQDSALEPVIANFRTRAAVVFKEVNEAVALGRAGQQAAAMQRLKDADDKFTVLTDEITIANNERIAAASKDSAELSASTERNVLIALIVSILATAGALFAAHRIIRGSVVRPLIELTEQMDVLAKGNHAITIGHQERKDEIGVIGRSVAVFRTQAEERHRLEAAKKQADVEQSHVVATVGEHLDSLASGDLTAEIREEFPASYVQLKDSFNSALASLGGLIRSVAESAGQIRTGSSEIAQASEDLARRTESNAASLEETSAAIVQMDERIKASAGAATQTVGRADQAIATVGGGRALADEAVQAMGRVSDSAKGIDSVIEGLDKIAFQTRVLAMNAAVEAGRAGEAGRGFAVVADLVSALAMRAEEEAKRARDQLTVTQTDINSAVGAVEKVDAALQNISADVGEVHQLLGSMAADNQAQAQAITEINAAVSSMDQSTQQNAAMVEETSAAARNLLTEVSGLAEQAGKFRCDGGETAHALPTRVKAKALSMPRRAKEGGYTSPVKPLPAAAVAALTRGADDDWKDF